MTRIFDKRTMFTKAEREENAKRRARNDRENREAVVELMHKHNFTYDGKRRKQDD